MAWWTRLFASRTVTLEHPLLGRVKRTWKNMWQADAAAPIGCRGTPSLTLHGNAEGPTPECVANYQRLQRDWDRISPQIESQIFELNQNYCSENHSEGLSSPMDVWQTSELLDIHIISASESSMTYRFDWQNANDGHLITFYFTDWTIDGMTIDG